MKFLVAFAAFAAVASAAPAEQDQVPILSQHSDLSPDGSWQSAWESGNGISVQESGILKNAGHPEAEAQEVQGQASWTAPDGQVIQLKWVANENGYQPEGSHLPTTPAPPEVPQHVLRALEWIAAHPEPATKQLH